MCGGKPRGKSCGVPIFCTGGTTREPRTISASAEGAAVRRCCVQPQAPPRAARPATDSPPLSCIDWKPFPSSICSLFKRSSSLNSDHHVSKLIYLQQTQTFKMAGKALLNSHPKACLGSKGARKCRVCANPSAIIRKYHIDMCRQCFRERARDIGFTKVCYLLTI